VIERRHVLGHVTSSAKHNKPPSSTAGSQQEDLIRALPRPSRGWRGLVMLKKTKTKRESSATGCGGLREKKFRANPPSSGRWESTGDDGLCEKRFRANPPSGHTRGRWGKQRNLNKQKKKTTTTTTTTLSSAGASIRGCGF